jgi:hypothetical protein
MANIFNIFGIIFIVLASCFGIMIIYHFSNNMALILFDKIGYSKEEINKNKCLKAVLVCVSIVFIPLTFQIGIILTSVIGKFIR